MMKNKKKTGLTELIVSSKPEMINARFLVKASVFDDGVHDKSILLIVTDLLENGFTMKFFKTDEAASSFLKLLHAASIN
jgi:hypoxanthine-guanine phosphoribosyltransferase